MRALDFNSYGSRRGNHEVMMRGTFANVRLRNRLAPGTEGGFTTYLPSGEVMPLFNASMKYQAEGTPLIILAGKEYGSGSSRDWAAKGPRLLGVKAVIAESFERIHRSNLVGMGILPLQFQHEENVELLGLTGHEHFDIVNLPSLYDDGFVTGKSVRVRVSKPGTETLSRWSSTPPFESTPSRSCCTTRTAAFCSTSCGACWTTTWCRSRFQRGCRRWATRERVVTLLRDFQNSLKLRGFSSDGLLANASRPLRVLWRPYPASRPPSLKGKESLYGVCSCFCRVWQCVEYEHAIWILQPNYPPLFAGKSDSR